MRIRCKDIMRMNTPQLTISLLLGLFLTACEGPPMVSEQTGYRGTGMVEINNPESTEALKAANQLPPETPLMPAVGPYAKDVYENVEVLGDITVSEFVGLMTAMAQWVAPEEDCAYCHNVNNFASDEKYTKIVARRMLQMTRDINANWKDHVADTGVTCYTCHRGKPVPEYLWFEGGDLADTKGMAASRNGQNLASGSVGYSSLPYDPFSSLINAEDAEIIVQSVTGLPVGKIGDIADTEKTYALMIHMSESLGVNCGYCHNSRAFAKWEQSTPARVTAWHGLRMASDLNREYLSPLLSTYPSERLGPMGDAPKLNCSTCHQGLAKPLYGVNSVQNYPALTAYFNNTDELIDSMLVYIESNTHTSEPEE